ARTLYFVYGNYGRLDTLRDALARSTHFAYDNADRVTSTTLPDNSQLQFGYDHNGNVTSITPPGASAHTLGYSAIDQLVQYTPPSVTGISAPATSYTYNDDHQLTRVTRPDGALVQLAYDASKGRLDSVTIARGKVSVFYSDTTGQVSSLTSPDTVTVGTTYDGPLLTSEAWSGKMPGGASVTVNHSYSSWFWDSTVTVGGGTPITYGHDLDGLIVSAAGLTIHHRADNGLTDSTKVSNLTNSMDYDDAGALANLSYSTDTLLFRQSIARDALGRITHILENDFGTSRDLGYRYDLAGRLYGVTLNGDTIAIYRYDSNGNRTSFKNPQSSSDTATASYDAQDRLLRYRDSTYTYTAAGELASKTGGSSVTGYVYDPLGNLVRVALPSADTLTYSSDGAGRRVGRRMNGSWSGGWVYQNALNVAGELDQSGAVIRRYVYGVEGHVPALMLEGSNTYRLITDQLGSVRGVVDVSSGAVVQRRDYDAWGVVTASSGTNTQEIGYAGGLTDASTGLVRFGARDYDPVAARWTCKDPILFAGGSTSLSEYAADDPVNNSDPSGLFQYLGGHDFQWWGKYGGPGWTNGRHESELENNAYLPGQDGFVRPKDLRDELYREHDFNLRMCAKIPDEALRQKCRAEADVELGASLARSQDRGDPCTRYLTQGEQLIFLLGQPNGWTPGRYVK
ncbi:MAG: RHS repeat domain-containing protein, partial [Candidatus Eiseniibacteriota bacterium]